MHIGLLTLLEDLWYYITKALVRDYYYALVTICNHMITTNYQL